MAPIIDTYALGRAEGDERASGDAVADWKQVADVSQALFRKWPVGVSVASASVVVMDY